MADDSNWVPTNFTNAPQEVEAAEGDSLSSFPSESITLGGSAVPDTQYDDLSFDAISRQKLSLTPKSSGSSHDRPSPKASGGVPCFEEDTRSSWSVDSAKNISFKEAAIDEDSQNSFSSQKSSLKRRYSDDEMNSGCVSISAENLFEYQWPTDKGDFYILQEQICDYLMVKSFKRKYPDLLRKPVEMDEKQFLKEKGIVSETQCDLGLTALRSDDVMELMSKDYPEKYHEYVRVCQEKERQSISDKHRGYSTPSIDKNKMGDFIKRAVHSAAEYNAHINHERREERRACFDLQTFTIHYPTGKFAKSEKEPVKLGQYPVALLPGQYQDYYRTYTSQELKYFPLNTVLYGPPQELGTVYVNPGSEGSHSDSEDSSSEESCSSSQCTHDGSGESSSGSDASPKPKKEPADTTHEKTPLRIISDNHKLKSKVSTICKVCKGGTDKNKEGKPEELIPCSECGNSSHPSCLDLPTEIIEVLKTYPWQCMDCKTCMQCMDPYDEDKMMFCDQCDRGYHTFCVGLKNLPSGRWICPRCAICASCGSTLPGLEGTRAQWQHEYIRVTRPDGETVRRHQLLCLTCTKQRKTSSATSAKHSAIREKC